MTTKEKVLVYGSVGVALIVAYMVVKKLSKPKMEEDKKIDDKTPSETPKGTTSPKESNGQRIDNIDFKDKDAKDNNCVGLAKTSLDSKICSGCKLWQVNTKKGNLNIRSGQIKDGQVTNISSKPVGSLPKDAIISISTSGFKVDNNLGSFVPICNGGQYKTNDGKSIDGLYVNTEYLAPMNI